MTPHDVKRIREISWALSDLASKMVCDAYEAARECPLPDRLRRAEPRDIVVGAIIWYSPPVAKNPHYWKIVDEVLRPGDDFKAYVADDGARYGLAGAYVEEAAL